MVKHDRQLDVQPDAVEQQLTPRSEEERARLISVEAPDRAREELAGRAAEMTGEIENEVTSVEAEARQAHISLEPGEQSVLDQVQQESRQRERELLRRLDEAKRLVEQKKAALRKLKVSSVFSSKRRFEKIVVADELEEAQQKYEQALEEYKSNESSEGQQAAALHEKRQQLAAAEQTVKTGGIRGLVRRFTETGWQREQQLGEIAEIREQYELERAELMADSVEAILEEQSRIADARAIENYESMHWLYKMNRTLGEVNLAEEAGWKPKGRFGRIVASQLSVQKLIKMSLLGVSTGLAISGVGALPLSAMMVGRRLATGAAMGASRYERKAKKELATVQSEVMKKELGEMTTDELNAAINDMTSWAEINGVMISAHPAYRALMLERGKRMNAESQEIAEQRGGDMSVALSEMLAQADADLDAARAQIKARDALLQRESVALGAFFASGLYAEGIKQATKAVSFAVEQLGLDDLAGVALDKAMSLVISRAQAAEVSHDVGVIAAATEAAQTADMIDNVDGSGLSESAEVGVTDIEDGMVDSTTEIQHSVTNHQILDAEQGSIPLQSTSETGASVSAMDAETAVTSDDLVTEDLTPDNDGLADAVVQDDQAEIRHAAMSDDSAPSDHNSHLEDSTPSPEYAIEDSSQGFEYQASAEAVEKMNDLGVSIHDGALYYGDQAVAHFVAHQEVSDIMEASPTESVIVTTDGDNLVVHIIDTDGTETNYIGGSTDELYASMLDEFHRDLADTAARLSGEANRMADAIASGDVEPSQVDELMGDLQELRQVSTNYSNRDGIISAIRSMDVIEQAIKQAEQDGGEGGAVIEDLSGADSEPGALNAAEEVPGDAATEVPTLDPELAAQFEDQAGRAVHDLVRALDKLNYGNLTYEDAYALTERYEDLAGEMQGAGAGEIAEDVMGPVQELQRKAAEVLTEGAQEKARLAHEGVELMRQGAISEQEALSLVSEADQLAEDCAEHGLVDAARSTAGAADQLDQAYQYMYGEQGATGLYADAADQAAERAGHARVTTPREFITQEVPRAIRSLDDRLIDRPLDVLEHKALRAISGISEEGVNPDDVPLPKSLDTLPDYDPDVPTGERMAEFQAERQADRAQELADLQEAEEVAREAAHDQHQALEGASSDTAAAAEARDMLNNTGQIRAERAAVQFLQRRNGSFEVSHVEGDVQEFEAVQKYLSPDYQQIIANGQGTSVAEASRFIDMVEGNAHHLAHLREARDAMLDQGLGNTPQFEALDEEIQGTLSKIHRYGHLLKDDPALGGPSKGQAARAALGKMFQAGTGRAPR